MSLLNTVGLKGIKLSTRRNLSRLNWIPNYCFLIKTIHRDRFVDFCTIKPNKIEKSSTIRTPVKSVNSNSTLAVHSPKFGQAKTHFLSQYGEKKIEKTWLDRVSNSRPLGQKLIVLTITTQRHNGERGKFLSC